MFCLDYFKSWQFELQKVREENARAQNVARILQRGTLGRILQAWRVVNQEECIIEPLVRRRVRRRMARWGFMILMFWSRLTVQYHLFFNIILIGTPFCQLKSRLSLKF